MCKFCETKTKRVLEKKRSKHSHKETYVNVDKVINPSWDDAQWTMDKYFDIGKEEGCPMKVELNLESNEIEFSYNAYSCDSSFYAYLKISYCPFCGRKLK